MAERKKTPASDASTLSDKQLDKVQGGSTAAGDLRQRGDSSTKSSQKTIIGGFKSVSGLDSETEVVE